MIDYVEIDGGICPEPYSYITEEEVCEAAGASLGYTNGIAVTAAWTNRPRGCYAKGAELYFNNDTSFTDHGGTRNSICYQYVAGTSVTIADSSDDLPSKELVIILWLVFVSAVACCACILACMLCKERKKKSSSKEGYKEGTEETLKEGAGSRKEDKEVWLGDGDEVTPNADTVGAEYEHQPPPPPGLAEGSRARLANTSLYKTERWTGAEPISPGATYGGVQIERLQVYSSTHGWVDAEIVQQLDSGRILVKYDKNGRSFQKRVHRSDRTIVRSNNPSSIEEAHGDVHHAFE